MSIVTDYQSGMSLKQISNARGIEKSKVRKYLIGEGVTMRPAHRYGGTIYPEKARLVVSLILGGQYTFSQIAERAVVSYTFVKLRSAEMQAKEATR